jgi:hypothetical protein
MKNWKKWLIILGVVLGIIFLFLLLNLITINFGKECGYSRGTSCPSDSKECTCFGVKTRGDFLGFVKKVGGHVNYYCLGKCYNCKCYEEGCPVSTSYKKEINCSK